MKRIYSIDFTRGLAMIIMALDHVRDLMHINSIKQSPTDLSTTTPILFFTRWVTYLCAPIFVFLAGTSAQISFKARGNPGESRSLLFKRGLWLIGLEFTLLNLGLFFDAGFHTLIFEVIATIGFGFIILSVMSGLPLKLFCIAGFIILFFHGLVPLIPLGPDSMMKKIISYLFSPGAFMLSSNRVFIMGYPPIPWLGIMLVGYSAGRLFELPEEKRKRIFLWIGFGTLLFFVILRLLNVYGDPSRWSSQKTFLFSLLSFVNVSKYPPSLLFSLVTLGIMFIILAISEGLKGSPAGLISVYGKTPLFYFILHFYIIHTLLIVILLLQGISWSEMSFATGTFGRPKELKSGVPLWAIYLIWIVLVLILYRPCAWFGKYKAEHGYWWLKFI